VGAVLLIAVVLPSACEKSSTAPTGPSVTNNPDDFSYQTPHYNGHTGVESYTWSNSGDSASVHQASSLSSGYATLTIKDGIGTQVYLATLSTTGTFPTAKGNRGAWNIRVDYAQATGTVGFRVQKR